MSKFIKGMDLSTLLEMERCGAKYYDKGEELDILEIMKRYDVDTIRLRIWNDPKSESGEPYGAANNDFEETLRIAKRYHKDIIMAEVSMGYTMEDYKEYEKLEDHERKGYATRQELVDKIDYPMTVQGQMDFTADFLNRVANVAIAPRYVATWRRCIAIEKTGVIMGLSTKTKIITDGIKGEKEKEV